MTVQDRDLSHCNTLHNRSGRERFLATSAIVYGSGSVYHPPRLADQANLTVNQDSFGILLVHLLLVSSCDVPAVHASPNQAKAKPKQNS